MLVGFYLCNDQYYKNHNHSNLNKENVIDLFLLTLKIEIDVP